MATTASGLTPSDTTAVTKALVTTLSREDSIGIVPRPTWHVTLTLEGRPYDAEAVIDRQTDSTVIQRVHKPL
jgi:hypothetical protein